MLKKHAKMFNIGIDKHSTIPHLMRNPENIPSSYINKGKKNGSSVKLVMTSYLILDKRSRG